MANNYLERLNSIAMLDPAITTRNAGDEIISQAARTEIESLFPEHFISTIPTHEAVGTRSYRLTRQSQYSIVAGSNILSGRQLSERQWRLKPWDALFLGKLIFLAVGWRSYGSDIRPLSAAFLRTLQDSNALHSVRDEYTKQRVMEAGIPNVANTGCVTMWRLDMEALKALPLDRSEAVVTTINAGTANVDTDKAVAKLLTEKYKQVYVWPQGIDDLPYVKSVFPENVTILGSNLSAYDRLLREAPSLDYVGTRLHGGIRALQHKRRTTILAVDNRATEISKDTGLPVVVRKLGIDAIADFIDNPKPIDIKLPWTEINRWRAQFKAKVAGA